MPSLSELLKSATAEVHQQAEDSPFVSRLMSGDGTPDDFSALIVQQYPVYAALEQQMRRHASGPVAAAVHDPALERHDALRADLAHLVGPTWQADLESGALPVHDATRSYVAAIAAVTDPVELVAHHYVRYLGDLSGGQIIARLVSRHYGIAPEGLSFYRFDSIAKPKVYKDEYRARLDALALDDEQRGVAATAAVDAFQHNRAVFADLEQGRQAELVTAG